MPPLGFWARTWCSGRMTSLERPASEGVGIAAGTDILDGTGFPLDLYLPGMSEEQRRNPDVSPLYADLRGMPTALFSVGSSDHLLDDSLFMAARWEVGRQSRVSCWSTPTHPTVASPCRRSPRTSSRVSSISFATVSRSRAVIATWLRVPERSAGALSADCCYTVRMPSDDRDGRIGTGRAHPPHSGIRLTYLRGDRRSSGHVAVDGSGMLVAAPDARIITAWGTPS